MLVSLGVVLLAVGFGGGRERVYVYLFFLFLNILGLKFVGEYSTSRLP